MSPALRSAFDELYEVFARYEDSSHCIRKSGINRPLRLLTRQDWDRTHKEFDMPVVLCDSTIFCHFLPRILEWFYEAYHSDAWLGFWGLGDLELQLEFFGWTRWPYEEAQALKRVFGLWISEDLLYPKKDISFPLNLLLNDEVNDEVEDDLGRYLNPWVQERPRDVAQWITQQDWSRPKAPILKWVTQPFVGEQLERAFWTNPDGEGAALLSRSIQMIESLRALEM